MQNELALELCTIAETTHLFTGLSLGASKIVLNAFRWDNVQATQA